MIQPFLPSIEAAFGDLMRSYGFRVAVRRPASPPDFVDGIQFCKKGQSVTVVYAHMREQWCEVTLKGYGDPEPVTDLMAFVSYATGEDARYISTIDPAAFSIEAKRCSELLAGYCPQFLSGALHDFRKTYRELFLVALVRTARYNAGAGKNWENFTRYNEWLRDYWTDRDTEEAALARRRGWRG